MNITKTKENDPLQLWQLITDNTTAKDISNEIVHLAVFSLARLNVLAPVLLTSLPVVSCFCHLTLWQVLGLAACPPTLMCSSCLQIYIIGWFSASLICRRFKATWPASGYIT